MRRLVSTRRRTHRPATVVGLLLALFMAAMEMTVVSTAMPTVVAELGGALHYAWVFTAYMLTSTVTVPIYGKLADLYGRKPVMMIGIALFLFGSMASGQARTMEQLIAFRAIQGIGAGGMQPMALTIVGDIFNLEERGRMQGIFGAVWAIAGLAGPLLGGVIVATLSWRWVFYVNVPFGLLSAAILAVSLVEEIDKREHRLDLAGAAVLVVAVVALLLGTDGHLPLVLLPASALLTGLFLWVEARAQEPILPLRLFRQRILATASALSALAGGAMLGVVTFLPLYAQGVLGSSPTEAGSIVAGMAVSWPVASAISGRLIVKLGFRALVRTGFLMVAASSVLMAALLAHHASAMQLRLVAVLFGIGMGLSNSPLIIGVQTAVTFAERGVATASTMFFRNIGGTLAVGVMGVVLASALTSGAARNVGGASLVAKILGPERRSLDPSVLASISGDLELGVGRVMWIVAGLAVAAAATGFLFPRVVPPAAKKA
ncbi:MAG: drug resistance transporter, EmrB/QacA family [Labilithrix sp.]|nr:drug resistance transporter, EmrB/QacA family [Labilithrix sp.]